MSAYFDVPRLAERIDDSLLVDGRSTRRTNRQVELLVTLDTVEFALGLARHSR